MERVLAIVLPPGESFAPDASGAIGLIARRHARWIGSFAATVIGTPPPTTPFTDVPFRPVQPRFWFARIARAYAEAVAALAPVLIEIHNRPELALALARRFPRIPLTLILNNDPRGMRGTRRPADRARLWMRLAGIATASRYLADCFTDGTNLRERPFILPNCLDIAAVPPPASERDPVILFAGRMVADKGADAFVAACALALPRLPGWRAEMIGGDRFGPDNPETPFLRTLRPAAEAACVRLLGYRPHAAVLEAMARAAIVVVPSRWPEPFGLVAVEAMACGAALLCSNRGGLAEVTGDAAFAIDPDNSAGIADAIVAVASDPTRRARLAAAGLVRARRFDLAQVGPALDAFRAAALAGFQARDRHPI